MSSPPHHFREDLAAPTLGEGYLIRKEGEGGVIAKGNNVGLLEEPKNLSLELEVEVFHSLRPIGPIPISPPPTCQEDSILGPADISGAQAHHPQDFPRTMDTTAEDNPNPQGLEDDNCAEVEEERDQGSLFVTRRRKKGYRRKLDQSNRNCNNSGDPRRIADAPSSRTTIRNVQEQNEATSKNHKMSEEVKKTVELARLMGIDVRKIEEFLAECMRIQEEEASTQLSLLIAR